MQYEAPMYNMLGTFHAPAPLHCRICFLYLNKGAASCQCVARVGIASMTDNPEHAVCHSITYSIQLVPCFLHIRRAEGEWNCLTCTTSERKFFSSRRSCFNYTYDASTDAPCSLALLVPRIRWWSCFVILSTSWCTTRPSASPPP